MRRCCEQHLAQVKRCDWVESCRNSAMDATSDEAGCADRDQPGTINMCDYTSPAKNTHAWQPLYATIRQTLHRNHVAETHYMIPRLCINKDDAGVVYMSIGMDETQRASHAASCGVCVVKMSPQQFRVLNLATSVQQAQAEQCGATVCDHA